MAANAPVVRPEFSPEALERLFFAARDQVAATVSPRCCGPAPDFAERLGDLATIPTLGAFVSFKKRGRLRSCMGYMSEGVALGKALQSAAISAAREDPRFPPLDPSEFYDLDMEIWALGGMREVTAVGEARVGAIQVGRDGIQIQGRGRRGLLLPSVATEFGWDERRFLDAVCDKAGLARGAWLEPDVRLFAFEGVAFKKPFVYLASQNPGLAATIAERVANGDEAEASSGRRPTFSFASNFFNLSAPSRKMEPRSRRVRPAAVAGQFYPGTRREQEAVLDGFLAKIGNDSTPKIAASGAMVPHAGWVFSGFTAAKTLSRLEFPETTIILAPKHRAEGANFAIMPLEAWSCGDGREIPNDAEFIDEFAAAFPEFQKDEIAHRREHSIEVQLPMLARFAPKTKVVGLLVGRSGATELNEMARRFAQFLTNREKSGRPAPLLLISSDMNHYATDAATREIDAKALAALDTTDPGTLYQTVVGGGISMCGVLPAFFALTTLKIQRKFSVVKPIHYATSAEAFGDKERVVGYAGRVFL